MNSTFVGPKISIVFWKHMLRKVDMFYHNRIRTKKNDLDVSNVWHNRHIHLCISQVVSLPNPTNLQRIHFSCFRMHTELLLCRAQKFILSPVGICVVFSHKKRNIFYNWKKKNVIVVQPCSSGMCSKLMHRCMPAYVGSFDVDNLFHFR